MGNSKKLNLRFKIWLESEDQTSILGDGKWILLKTIEETGSLNLAMQKLGLSYRKTWEKLRRIEETLGFRLIERQRGGAHGGKSSLTPRGKKLVEIFDQFHKDYDVSLNAYLQNLVKKIQEV